MVRRPARPGCELSRPRREVMKQAARARARGLAFSFALAAAGLAGGLRAEDAGGAGRPVVVRVERKGEGFQLTRDGKPYFIRGAGGGGSKALLREVGGNSFRTWGADNLEAALDEAQKLGLTVTVG